MLGEIKCKCGRICDCQWGWCPDCGRTVEAKVVKVPNVGSFETILRALAMPPGIIRGTSGSYGTARVHARRFEKVFRGA